ncbi:MAG: hypothetical protein RKE49_14700 [Oceanicaulis sp.]
MPGTPRHPEFRAELEARAKALREGGASMSEVERETGVPASTLYQWAARGGWRACDLAQEAVRAAMEDQHPAQDAPDPNPDSREGRADGADSLTPAALSAEADRCAGAAMVLSRQGRMKAAEAALKLAERYRALAGEGAGAGAGLAALSANEKLILSKARLRHAPHVIYAINLVTAIDERRARAGEPLWLERDYGMGPWAPAEQIAAFKAAALAGPVTPPRPLPIWDLPDFDWR